MRITLLVHIPLLFIQKSEISEVVNDSTRKKEFFDNLLPLEVVLLLSFSSSPFVVFVLCHPGSVFSQYP